MATDTSKQCTLTNNSAKDIVVTLAIPGNETPGNGAAINVNGTMEVLKTSDGNTVIKAGGSGTITLDHNYKPGSDESGYVKAYDLVAGDSTWLYPLASFAVTQQSSNGTAAFAAQTISSGNSVAMQQAAAFYQTIAVYPDSGLATDYNTAVDAAKAAAESGGSTGAIAEAVNSFFKNTTDYKEVTIAHLAAIDDYYNNFPAVWAQYKDSLTYYLYGSDGTTAGFAGTLSLQKSGALDITKSAGGYTCTFAPAKTSNASGTEVDNAKAVSLTYVDGLFVDDAKAAQPGIALRGTFLLQSLFTGKATENNILTVVTGNVSGRACIGFDKPQSSAPPALTPMQTSPAEAFWNSLIHPKTQNEIIITVAVFAGAVAVLGAIAGIIYKIVKAGKANSWTEWEGQFQSRIDEWNAKVRLLAGPDAPPIKITNLKQFGKIVQDEFRAEDLSQAFRNQRTCLEKYIELAPLFNSDTNASLQTMLANTKQSIQNLENTRPDELGDVVTAEFKNFGNTQRKIKIMDTTTRKELSAEAQEVVDTNLTAGDRLYNSVGDSIENDAKQTENREPEAEGKLFPEW